MNLKSRTTVLSLILILMCLIGKAQNQLNHVSQAVYIKVINHPIVNANDSFASVGKINLNNIFNTAAVKNYTSGFSPKLASYLLVKQNADLFEKNNAIDNKENVDLLWWQHWWTKLIAFVLIMALVLYMLLNYILEKKQYQRTLSAQQDSIRHERQRISSEIHDDIGSGLFAIQLFADMASKARTDVSEIEEISLMINDMSKKINQIIWSTNMENDNLENLLYYIQFQTTGLFDHSDILFESSIADNVPDISITGQNRKNIYLIVKELVHNSIKHSGATKIKLTIVVIKNQLVINLQDNGKGFQTTDIKSTSMGLANIEIRLSDLKGTFVIDSTNGTVIDINIPLSA